ncbi:late embryogenesis abundant protein 18 [Mercurialis annua]|uniref:late embryogenesis abundant protein 18 n=1 Tax=Mercurialis annua TaxID=3986 RepID=UPI002160F912|nr:late embryogenesis abundant protein 18 [Mercurialis annua]
MLSAKEKLSNMASAAKEHLTICQAKVEEKVEKATARTHEQKKIAKERRKAKEAQAKMELHQAKAKHAADKLRHHHLPVVGTQYGYTQPPAANRPVGTTATMAGTAVPTYPLGGHPPGTYV